jgi:hypothetical protein
VPKVDAKNLVSEVVDTKSSDLGSHLTTNSFGEDGCFSDLDVTSSSDDGAALTETRHLLKPDHDADLVSASLQRCRRTFWVLPYKTSTESLILAQDERWRRA